MIGNPSDVLDKAVFQSFFDIMFVSARAAHFVDTRIAGDILRSDNRVGSAIVAIETGKFLVPLLRDQKCEFDRKVREFCEKKEWSAINRKFLAAFSEFVDMISFVSTPSLSAPTR
jgi:hypothetical protein